MAVAAHGTLSTFQAPAPVSLLLSLCDYLQAQHTSLYNGKQQYLIESWGRGSRDSMLLAPCLYCALLGLPSLGTDRALLACDGI